MRGNEVEASASCARITAEARVATSFSRCFGLDRKVIAPAAAFSSDPTCRMRVPASPAIRPPRRETISPSVMPPGIGSLRRGLARLERPDHLVGDVDARAREHRVLEDDVELLLLRDLADDAVRKLHHLGELLVPPLVQVLPELALLPLEVAVEVGEFALAVAALRLAHGDGVAVEVVLHALQLRGDLGELLVALLELGLDLLLRALRRGGVAQDALGVDEAELAREGRRLLLGRKGKRRRGERHGEQGGYGNFSHFGTFRTRCRR